MADKNAKIRVLMFRKMISANMCKSKTLQNASARYYCIDSEASIYDKFLFALSYAFICTTLLEKNSHPIMQEAGYKFSREVENA